MNNIQKIGILNSFYAKDELSRIGFRSIGENIRISRHAKIYNPDKITLGNDVRIDDFSIIGGGKELSIGNHVHIACFCGIFGGSGVFLGDFSGISSHVLIYSESDDYSGNSLTNPTIPILYKPDYKKGPVILGRHSIIGAHSTILPNLVIGEGVAIGAHSLVTKSCEPWGIYSGVPARKIKDRKKNILELEKSYKNSKR